MSNKKWAKIMAIIALFAIVVSILWTWILYFLETRNQNQTITITPEELEELYQQYLEENWEVETDSNIEEVEN